jgi:hypothetical protein
MIAYANQKNLSTVGARLAAAVLFRGTQTHSVQLFVGGGDGRARAAPAGVRLTGCASGSTRRTRRCHLLLRRPSRRSQRPARRGVLCTATPNAPPFGLRHLRPRDDSRRFRDYGARPLVPSWLSVRAARSLRCALDDDA